MRRGDRFGHIGRREGRGGATCEAAECDVLGAFRFDLLSMQASPVPLLLCRCTHAVRCCPTDPKSVLNELLCTDFASRPLQALEKAAAALLAPPPPGAPGPVTARAETTAQQVDTSLQPTPAPTAAPETSAGAPPDGATWRPAAAGQAYFISDDRWAGGHTLVSCPNRQHYCIIMYM